ncbi:MAG: LLM class flavin-dependent oxidoreductase [Gammaproteobacteria bacterium]|nr:LLM class flavin-dependent oxidoreductase [Gammaproteobacteria bacterium]
MKVGAFYLPSIGSFAEIQKGMAGRRTDLYQQMLDELSEQIKFMDAHGFYGVGFTEHHFHIEGEEVSTNPVMLDLYFGMQTKSIKLGQLGNVLPSHNPVRLAEDIAMLDQMTKGRAFAGFARGYQPRWVNVLGQQIKGLDGTFSEAEYEQLKKDLYYDHFEIIKKCWMNDTFSHRSRFWQIPAPNTHWAAHDVTRKYGRGVDENNILTEIGIVPPPFQKKMPDLFQPFSVSESSIRWAMENDVVPVTILTHPEVALSQFQAAQDAANKMGKNYKLGEKIGLVREVIVADTDAEALEIARNGGSIIWCNFFGPFGFNAAVAAPGEGAFDVPNNFESMAERGLVIFGSPDTVNRKLEALFKTLPAEYFWMFTYNGLIPQKQMMRHLELVSTKVLPNFTDTVR